MATIKEKDLTQVASLADADFIRAVSSAGESEIVKYQTIRQRIVSEVQEDLPAYAPVGYCYCNSITATTVTTQNADVKLPITGINLANGFTYDSSNKGVKVTNSGVYAISVQSSCTTATSGDMMGIGLQKNGTSIESYEYHRINGTYERVQLLPTILELSAGDVITVVGRNNSGARGSFNTLRFAAWRLA